MLLQFWRSKFVWWPNIQSVCRCYCRAVPVPTILPTSLLSQLKGYWRHTYLWTLWPVDSPQCAKKLFGSGVSICVLI